MSASLLHLAPAAGERTARAIVDGLGLASGAGVMRGLVASACIDDMLLTLAPLLAAGGAPGLLEGDPLNPPGRLLLSDVHRAGEHLFMHYVAGP